MERNIKLLAWFNLFIEFVLYTPVAIIYFSRVSGSFALGMSVFSIIMVASALFEIPTGIFSDLIGRKNTVVVGAISNVIGVIFYAIGGSYLFLVIGAVFEGLGRSFYSGNNDALLHDTLTAINKPHEFHIYSGKLSSLEQFGTAVMSIVGSVIASISFVLVMWLSVIPKVINVIIALNLVEPPHMIKSDGNIYRHLKDSFLQFFQNRKLRLLTSASTIGYAFGEASFQFRAAFVQTLWPLWAVGLSNTLSNMGAAVSFYVSGRIINRLSELKVLIFENIFNRLVNLIALFFPTVLSPALMSVTSLTYGAGSVAKKSLFQKEFTYDKRATMGSLTSFLGSLVFGVIAIGIGFIADKTGPVKALITVNLFLLIPLWFYQQLHKIQKHENTGN
jgi:hypothetical protein